MVIAKPWPLFMATAMLGALSGCGGSGSDHSDSGGSNVISSQITGTAMAGLFKTGQVCAYAVSNGTQGSTLGCANVDSNSQYQIDLGSYVGDVLVAIAAGATYDDEATNGDETSGTPLTGSLRNLVHVQGGAVSVPLTPFTEAVVRSLSTLDLQALAAQAIKLKSILPLDSQVDLLTTLPSAADSNAAAMIYREMLRALSQLQANEGLSADLETYLTTLVTSLQQGDDASLAAWQTAFLTEVQSQLSANCSVSANVVSCTPPTTSGDPVTLQCDASKLAPGAVVHTPSSMELLGFAGSYSGKEGTYSDDFSTFNATGTAQLLLGVDGSVFYNGKQYALDSICMENNATYGNMLYLHLGQGELDLFASPYSDGTGWIKWSGTPPTDSTKTVIGDYVDGYDSDPNTGTTQVTLPNGNQITDAASISYQAIPNIAEGKIITYKEGTARVEVYYYVDTLGVGAADSGLSIGIDPANGCALNPQWANSFTPLCSDVGINFDRATGSISFNNTPMHPIVFSCPGDCRLNGTLNFQAF